MLTTSAANLLYATAGGTGSGATWRSVDIELWIPYLLVSRSTVESGTAMMKTTIMWIESDILEFCTGSDRENVLDVSVLIPDTDLCSSRRKLISVKEIIEVEYANDSGRSLTFLTVENELVLGHNRTEADAVPITSRSLYRLNESP